jgi:hypothetical protein
MQDKLVDRYEKRTSSLEDKLDRANKRTIWGTLGGLALGIGARIF